ncbi:GNAT family N-acetyltransferase [Pseudonocardia acaciae]|uniref:GNAT family N-acetyltransferase n=1 Tax=Pseudonocardia acaciae TaxID=551276 RepID=UPI00048D5385|nr:GNAT family N-acetyltransferase [Pseudonocardia acaciae]
MTPADLGFAMELTRAAGWNQTEADWRAHLALDPAGCFVTELDGRPAGTAVLADYGGRFGWLAMVLVHPEHRRRGVGTALARAAREHARERGLAQVRLDASEAGRPVYLALGFADQYGLSRYRRPPSPPAAENGDLGAREVGADEAVRAVLGWDAERFGADRGRVLRELLERPGSRTFRFPGTGAMSGYAVTRLGAPAVQLGPWLADTAEAAEALLHAALASVPDEEVIMDVPEPNADATALALRYGFAPERRFARMSWPAAPAAEDNRRIYASSGADRG